MGSWERELANEGPSGYDNLNFVWRGGPNDRVFIMDNHLAAAWCWAQVVSRNQSFKLIHIDRHDDLQNAQLTAQSAAAPDLWSSSLDDVTSATYLIPDSSERSKVTRWDNYILLFDRQSPKAISNALFVTHNDASVSKSPFSRHGGVTRVPVWQLLENLEDWTNDAASTVLNIDLDFFFTEVDGGVVRWASDEYLDQFARALAAALGSEHLRVVTIALSPECCGGWKEAIAALSRVLAVLSLAWPLPG